MTLSTSTRIIFPLLVLVVAISMAPSAMPYVGVVVGWFVLPIAWLIEAAPYVQEVDRKKPVTDQAIT
jgi:Na+-transporting methylmalonyl-CoA/oxaloacetate decarboxylase beta subunit